MLIQKFLQNIVLNSGGEQIEINYRRGKTETGVLKVFPQIEESKPKIGISMDEIGIAKLPLFSAFWEGMKINWLMIKSTVLGLFTLIKDGLAGKGSLDAVTGPIGLVGIVGDAYRFGFSYLISFAALISINLAIINLLPFPALDGGRLFFLLIEKIKGSRIKPKIANTLNMIGFYLLIFLMLLITYHDIVKLF